MIKIAMRTRRHDDIVTSLGRSDTSLCASPRHNSGIWCESAFEDLIPANDLFAFRIEIRFDALNEITLQLVLIGQVFIRHQLLAIGTGFPSCLWAFISTDVDVW